MQLQGKVCVVTGASSGIGLRTAERLAAEGATVCVAARREDRLKTLIAALPSGAHSYRVTDVREREQVQELAEHVATLYGRCDALVNNAGIPGRRIRFGDPGAVEQLETVLRTNLMGAVLCTSALLPLLERSAPSSVVNVASMAGRIAIGGSSAYTASKFGLVGWSEALHYDLAPRGVCVSLVEPGLLPTEGFPQDDLLGHPVLRHILTTDHQVAGSIVDAIVRRRFQRTVPRWYYLLQVPRVLTPWLWRNAADKVTAKYGRSRRS